MIPGQENFSGNEEHLKVLLDAIEKKDISHWNHFNVELQQKEQKADLIGVNLEGK